MYLSSFDWIKPNISNVSKVLCLLIYILRI
jgi:hypothetical protein